MKPEKVTEVLEPLRDVIGRILYQEPGLDRDWRSLSEERREPWRQDADRIIAIFPLMSEHFSDFSYEICGAKDTIIGCVFPIEPRKLWLDYVSFLKNDLGTSL